MTSELVVEVGNESLFFRFEGHGTKRRSNSCDYVKTVNLEIKREDLAFYENSMKIPCCQKWRTISGTRAVDLMRPFLLRHTR
jgi:hypothetical protein